MNGPRGRVEVVKLHPYDGAATTEGVSTSSPAGRVPVLDPLDQIGKSGDEFRSREVTVADPADGTLYEQIRPTVVGHPLRVDLLHEERHEEVAEVVQSQHRHRDPPVDHRGVVQAARDPTLWDPARFEGSCR